MALEILTESQTRFFDDEGYLVLERQIPEDILLEIRSEIARFEAEAAGMTASNDRLDLEDSHRPDAPRIRRIKRPNMISDAMDRLMRSDHLLAPVRDLIGPDLRLHTSKLNMKSAQYGAAIEWHQDWAFYPHTNDDVLAVGVLIDDISEANGPLMVFPGSHKGIIHNHHVDGVFAGAVDLTAGGLDPADAVSLTGPAGSLSIHHGRILHGSALNRSDHDRRLLFYEMAAADAFPVMGAISEFSTLEAFDARMLCGRSTIEPRMEPVPVRLPVPRPDNYGSIYEVQKRLKARAFDTAE